MKFAHWAGVAAVAVALPVMAGAVMAQTAVAQTVKSEATASNGVVVTVNTYTGADRVDYSATIRNADGIALVSRSRRGGTLGPTDIQGAFVYTGDWRAYDTAAYVDGASARMTSLGRHSGNCRSTPPFGAACTLTEQYRIDVSPADIAAHAQQGTLALRLSSSTTDAVAVIQLPLTYFEAVREVSERPR